MSHSPENQLLLAAARKPLSPAAIDIPGLVSQVRDWDFTLATAGRHGLSPLLFRLITDSGASDLMDADTLEMLRATYLNCLMNGQQQLNNVALLIDAFAARDIPVILMKGPALGLTVYEDIALRPFGDIDLLIPEDKIAQSKQIMKEAGYQAVLNNYFPIPDDRNEELGCEWTYHKDGFVVEIHWGIINRLAPFSIDIGLYWKDASRIEIDGRSVLIMNPAAQLMHLCLHQFKHHWKHLRDLTDIALMVNSRLDESGWAEMLLAAKAQGLGRCVYFNLLLAERVLGTPVPRQYLAELLGSEHPGLVSRAMVDMITENILASHLPRRLWEVLMVEGKRRKLASVKDAIVHPFPRKEGRSQTAPVEKPSAAKVIVSAVKTVFYYRNLFLEYVGHFWRWLRRKGRERGRR